MEKLVLIDGNSLINRAFYATPLLSTKDGVYTNAVYGFMNMFFKMLSDIKPTYVAVAFDVHAPTFRHKMYSAYKGTRKPSPPELHPQIDLLREVLRLMGIHVVEKAGIEADDIIGTIAKHTKIQTVIFTGDKDSFQLVDGETEVHFTKRGISEVEIYDNSNFTEKTGLVPKQIIELKALMGDSSDNIPGISGIGEKTAVSLLQTYGDVDCLYAHTHELKGKLYEKIVNGKGSAYLSKTLATINTDCDIDTDVNKMRYPEKFSNEVRKKFIQLELKSLYTKDELFEGKDNLPQEKTEKPDVKPITVDDLTEIKGLNPDTLSFSKSDESINLFDGKAEYVIKIRKTMLDDGFAFSEVLTTVIPLLNNTKKLIVFSKKDLKHYLYNNIGAEITSDTEDVSILKYLTDFSGAEEKEKDVIILYGKDETRPAFSLYEIYLQLKDKLQAEDMEKLYREVELPLSDVLFDMENSGFKIDVNALYGAGEKYGKILSELEEKIREYADDFTLNVNSPKQLGELLFEKMHLGKGKKTKTGYSTSAEVLESLEDAHPIIPLILKYRQLQKLQSTYIEGFKPLIDKRTGIIKTSFNQTVTSTGRLSSKEPNLQNIPVRDDEGKELRRFFVPRSEKGLIIGADYSQIELRLLAAFSGCNALIDAFKKGIDVHSVTASKVFGVEMENVTPAMRRAAKAVNFGIIYGISEYGLAKNIKCSAAEAKEYINSYFREYPEVKEYMNANVDFARKTGYAVTMLNRRRYIREINSPNYNLRQFGERAAMNMPLQGSAADIIKLAMLGVSKRLKKEQLKSQMILQIHDELIIDALESEENEVKKILKEEMENAVSLTVPLTVSMESGKTWYDAK